MILSLLLSLLYAQGDSVFNLFPTQDSAIAQNSSSEACISNCRFCQTLTLECE